MFYHFCIDLDGVARTRFDRQPVVVGQSVKVRSTKKKQVECGIWGLHASNTIISAMLHSPPKPRHLCGVTLAEPLVTPTVDFQAIMKGVFASTERSCHWILDVGQTFSIYRVMVREIALLAQEIETEWRYGDLAQAEITEIITMLTHPNPNADYKRLAMHFFALNEQERELSQAFMPSAYSIIATGLMGLSNLMEHGPAQMRSALTHATVYLSINGNSFEERLELAAQAQLAEYLPG